VISVMETENIPNCPWSCLKFHSCLDACHEAQHVSAACLSSNHANSTCTGHSSQFCHLLEASLSRSSHLQCTPATQLHTAASQHSKSSNLRAASSIPTTAAPSLCSTTSVAQLHGTLSPAGPVHHTGHKCSSPVHAAPCVAWHNALRQTVTRYHYSCITKQQQPCHSRSDPESKSKHLSTS
jgi:hypothetical protein